MSAPTPQPKRIATSVPIVIGAVLPADLVARLDAVCSERMIGRNLVITRAIEQFLPTLEAQ